ncbi:MAG TPA: heterodisulfide reductase-related iron-sulfur binding cluster [Blastocatellia bacterium]|nr:heterodisulfide reductase-related iron-sulfur binding cluster [Blastocatellia bacterium]
METPEKNIEYKPTDGLSYDPAEEKYWDAAALQKEVQRTFEICHGCRLCFKYCDSFPTLFSLVDQKYDGDVRRISSRETEAVMDSCFQCKLCEVQCPYTERDSHEFKLDFPKLVHRYKAQRARGRGFSLRDRVLADPDRAGAMARASMGIANAVNRVRIHRVFMEKVLGVHRDKLLPDFAATTFERWATAAEKIKDAPGGEVVLFQTCYVQNNEPQIGRDTVEVLEKNKVDVRCVKGLACCGMPAWERGDLGTLRNNAKTNLGILLPHVEAGAKVVAINPTCSMMMRRDYPTLVALEDRAAAEKVAAAVMDPSEFLWSIRDEPRFNTEFLSTPGGPVAYHAPCHLRAQAVGFKGRDLLRKIPGVVPRTVMECCGHDGTYAMTVEGFEASARIGRRAFDEMKDAGGELWATDCPLAALQFEQHAGVRPMHPMSILARAYREDGFPKRAGNDEDKESEK